MMKPESQRPITLEHIIRLKRAERPPAEFWTQFDRELRAKQLAALVEKRPWWRAISVAKVLGGVRRYQLPLGATAVLAVAVFSVREYHAPSAVVSPARTARIETHVVSVLPAEVAAVSVAVVALAAPRRAESVAGKSEFSVGRDSAGAPSDFATPPLSSEGLTQIIPLFGVAAGSDDAAESLSPGSRLIAENFAALQPAAPALTRILASPALGFESRALPVRSKPVEPLAQMKVPGGSRRATLIASATLVSTTAPVVTSDRPARGLSDERLYDTISRVNARGAGVLVKF